MAAGYYRSARSKKKEKRKKVHEEINLYKITIVKNRFSPPRVYKWD